MRNSSLKLVSNIMLKSRYEKNKDKYFPFDLLPPIYRDVRYDRDLSEYQRIQKYKQLFAAEYFIPEDNSDEELEEDD